MEEHVPLTLEKLKEELEPYKNTLVLDYFEVARLVDVIDGKDDFYWVLDFFKKGIVHSSCCTGWIPLKGKIDDKDYEQLVRVWNLNNVEKAI